MKKQVYREPFDHERWGFWFYNLCFLLLAIMAIYFYEERIYGSDASSYLFGVVNNEWFYTERGRIVIWLSQWLPLLAVWFGLPMKAVLIAHSLGHVLFFYFVFLLGHCVFRNNHSGPIVIGIQLLGVAFTYFAWPYGEVQYGLALVLIMMWMIQAAPIKAIYRYGVSVLLCSFLIGSHPLVWIVAVFSVSCALIELKLRKSAMEYAAVGIALMFVKIILFPSYDGELANGAIELFLNRNYTSYELLSMVRMKPVLHTVVLGSWLLLLLSGLFRQLTFSVISFLLITAVIGLYSPLNAATEQYYMAYSGIALMSIVVNDYSSKRRSQRAVTLVNVFVVIASLFYVPEILSAGHLHRLRTSRIKALISNCYENGIHHGVVKGANFLKRAPSWSDPDLFHEVILLSSQEKTVRIQMFEHVLHHLNISEVRGPNAPRLKNLNYAFTDSNQAIIRSHILDQQPEVLNHRLFNFGTSVDSVSFLNTLSINTLTEVEGCYIENPYAELKQGQLWVRFRIVNENETPIYSAQPDNINVELLVCGKQILLGKDLEMMTDVRTFIDELIKVPVSITPSCITIRLMHTGQLVHEIQCPVNTNE